MLSGLLLVSLVLCSALVQALDAKVTCKTLAGGSCDPMSTLKVTEGSLAT